MTTHVTSSNPVRTDIAVEPSIGRTGRAWALCGVGAGAAGLGTVVVTGSIDAVYDPDIAGDPEAIVDRLTELTGTMIAFHLITMVGVALMVVFAAGLFRRLRATAPESSLAPLLGFAGLFGTAVVSVLGAGLNTEFIFALSDDESALDPANIALYNHWIGTIPWLWVLAGLSGLALFGASRAKAVPRWIGFTGLILGGLTLLLGISPLQYMAGMTGPLMVLVVALGFCFGDRSFRR